MNWRAVDLGVTLGLKGVVFYSLRCQGRYTASENAGGAEISAFGLKAKVFNSKGDEVLDAY
jgi:hypothetical protein